MRLGRRSWLMTACLVYKYVLCMFLKIYHKYYIIADDIPCIYPILVYIYIIILCFGRKEETKHIYMTILYTYLTYTYNPKAPTLAWRPPRAQAPPPSRGFAPPPPRSPLCRSLKASAPGRSACRIYRKTMIKPWENPEKTIETHAKACKNPWKTMENHQKCMENPMKTWRRASKAPRDTVLRSSSRLCFSCKAVGSKASSIFVARSRLHLLFEQRRPM